MTALVWRKFPAFESLKTDYDPCRFQDWPTFFLYILGESLRSHGFESPHESHKVTLLRQS